MKKVYLLLTFFISIGIQAQCWKSVSVGYSHTIAIADNGTLWSWGYNHFGELGDGTIVAKSLPVQIGSDTNWKEISASLGPKTFNLALKDDGTLWSWGNNKNGQLGDGTTINKSLPIQVGIDTNWNLISAGYAHALALKKEGTLWSWGDSSNFALGFGCSGGAPLDKLTPTQIGTLNTWKIISAGNTYSLAVKTDNTTWGWGKNSGNPIGLNGSSTDVCTPTARSYNNTSVKATSAGDSYSYDLKTSNLLVVWGNPVYGESGGTTCAGCPDYYIKEFDCGDNTAAIIKTDGTLWYTGKKLGYTETTVQYTSSFIQFGTDTDWKTVSVGFKNGAALKNDGSLYTWGWNLNGELGIGTSGSNTSSLTLVGLACPNSLSSYVPDLKKNIIIYPNPSHKVIYIEPSDNLIQKISISDLSGKKLYEQENKNPINIESFQKGIYIVQIEAEGKVFNMKFIKE